MRVALYTGSRAPTDAQVRAVIAHFARHVPDVVLVGDCPTGIDREVAVRAKRRPGALFVCHAKWDSELGKGAGPARNQAMVFNGALYQAAGHTVTIYGAPNGGSGTEGTVEMAHKAGIRGTVVNPDGRIEGLDEWMQRRAA
jgi:hypothetical protein